MITMEQVERADTQSDFLPPCAMCMDIVLDMQKTGRMGHSSGADLCRYLHKKKFSFRHIWQDWSMVRHKYWMVITIIHIPHWSDYHQNWTCFKVYGWGLSWIFSFDFTLGELRHNVVTVGELWFRVKDPFDDRNCCSFLLMIQHFHIHVSKKYHRRWR